jgi:hypothetical protein
MGIRGGEEDFTYGLGASMYADSALWKLVSSRPNARLGALMDWETEESFVERLFWLLLFSFWDGKPFMERLVDI